MNNLRREIISDLCKELDQEMNKPKKARDVERITELNNMIFDLTGMGDEAVNQSIESSKNELLRKISENNKSSHIKIVKRISAAAACLLVILGLNAASLKTFGQNIFSAAYQLTKGGITINAVQSESSKNANSIESDPYGMKSKCAEYGFFPHTPDYIPDGFVLDDISEHCDETSDYLAFYYKNGDMKLNFSFTHYKSNDELPPIGIPTDTYNVTEEMINGNVVYILKEDSQFTAIYINKGVEYNIFAEGLDYNECQKILESLS